MVKDLFRKKWALQRNNAGIKEFQYAQFWDEVKSSPPAAVTIETISTCNRTCHYCPQSFKSFVDRKQYKMEEDLFRKIIDDLYDFGFHGTIDTAFVSEPLMDKRFVRLFSYAREKLPGSNITLTTNGDLLTAEKLKVLLDNCVTFVRITQHDQSGYSQEQEISDFLKTNEEYYHRVTILRSPDFIGGLLNWGGYYKEGGVRDDLREQCDNYEWAYINYAGILCQCCNDIYGEYSHGSLADYSFKELWQLSSERRLKLFNGEHIKSEQLCKECTGVT
jgi:hypothetical protein